MRFSTLSYENILECTRWDWLLHVLRIYTVQSLSLPHTYLHLSIMVIFLPFFQVNAVQQLGPCFTNQTCYLIDTKEWSGPLYLTIFIYGYIVPVNFIVTMICNSLVIIVLSQKNMRTPTNMVLLAMAIMDLLTIACPCPW